MSLKDIKKWRETETAENAKFTFISRIDELLEIAGKAEEVSVAWQEYCDKCKTGFGSGFEDHKLFMNWLFL